MIRLLLALGLSLSFLTVQNSASMSRSYNNNRLVCVVDAVAE